MYLHTICNWLLLTALGHYLLHLLASYFACRSCITSVCTHVLALVASLRYFAYFVFSILKITTCIFRLLFGHLHYCHCNALYLQLLHLQFNHLHYFRCTALHLQLVHQLLTLLQIALTLQLQSFALATSATLHCTSDYTFQVLALHASLSFCCTCNYCTCNFSHLHYFRCTCNSCITCITLVLGITYSVYLIFKLTTCICVATFVTCVILIALHCTGTSCTCASSSFACASLT